MFNDEIAICEDQYLAAMVFGKVQRICYLPNFIGYHYYINCSSLVQDVGRKSGSVCVSYAWGFNKVLSLCLHNEIPIELLILNWSNVMLVHYEFAELPRHHAPIFPHGGDDKTVKDTLSGGN